MLIQKPLKSLCIAKALILINFGHSLKNFILYVKST